MTQYLLLLLLLACPVAMVFMMRGHGHGGHAHGHGVPTAASVEELRRRREDLDRQIAEHESRGRSSDRSPERV